MKSMKIIGKDNFDREHVSDHLVAENVNPYYATRIVKLLNQGPEDRDTFYVAVLDDYVLYVFDPT